MKIRCLVVDDEPLGRDRVVTLLKMIEDAEVIGECETGNEAIRAISERSPDLVFLDVRMPGLDGFEVLAALPATAVPAVIFVTAHDDYAIKAFEVHAQDYLLKPFDRKRFFEAFSHAASRIRSARPAAELNRRLTLLEEIERNRSLHSRLPIRSGGRVSFLPVEEIDWIEAADNYVRIHAGGKVHILRQTLQKMEDSLPPNHFIRIHRSTIVNVTRISEIESWFSGEYMVKLEDGTKVYSSRQYRERLRALME